MHVDTTKILSDSGPSLQTGQPAGRVVYTGLPAYAMAVASKHPERAKECCAHQGEDGSY